MVVVLLAFSMFLIIIGCMVAIAWAAYKGKDRALAAFVGILVTISIAITFIAKYIDKLIAYYN